MSEFETVELTINGQVVQAKAGQSILEAVHELGLDQIPTLCYAPNLPIYGSCFVCVVEVEGRASLVPSCATKVAPGMVVNTRSDRVVASRKTALELLMSNHYADCIAPCVLQCPAHVDVQGYIALAARGQYAEAADLIRQTNPLPAVCGRVCVRKCEAVCRRQLIDQSVAINDLKRYITDSPGAYDSWPTRAAATGKRVSIVGAGPAGLTAAYFLGLRGHQCTIYEMMPEPGGMLRYGIPAYRLPREVLEQEVNYVTSRSGSTLLCNQKLGRDYSLAELRAKSDAVFLAMGAMGSNSMQVPGEEDTPGVLKGLDFLIDMAQKPRPITGTVVVVGGGNTAMDAARTARRLGAEKVVLVYRRTRTEMPADPMEIDASLDEGIDLVELAAPQELVLNDAGVLTAIKCIRMKLGEPDSSGRRRPVPVEGSEFIQNCDWCISAIGQSPVLDGITPDAEDMPAISRWNTLIADGLSFATRVPGVFTGGDVQTGPSVAIDCIAAGQRAARSIHAYLLDDGSTRIDLGELATMAHFNAHAAPRCDYTLPIVMRKDFLGEVSTNDLGSYQRQARQHMPELDVDERIASFEEVALGLDWKEARQEWGRCLSCGCSAADDCRLRELCSEYDVDLARYAGKVLRYQPDDSHPYIVIDNNKCILCGKCIRTCEKVLGESALSLVKRGFNALVQPAMGKPLAETACVACGNCEAACPTGALSVKLPFPGRAVVPHTVVESTCGFCSLACRIKVSHAGDGRYWIEPLNQPDSYLCRFGRFGSELYINTERVATPLRREGGQFIQTSFENAFADIVTDMRHAVKRYGPEAVAVFVSPEITNEQMYLAQRIAREALGTNNIACLSTLLTESKPGPLTPAFGFTASTADRSVIDEADLIVINNSDLKNEQLILAMRIIAALRRGAKVIAAAGVHGDLIELGTLNLEPLRGTATLMWEGVARELLNSGFDEDWINAIEGGPEFLASVQAVDLAAVSSVCGVERSQIEYCAHIMAEARHIVFIHSPDRTEDKAPGDLRQIGNLMTLLHSAGRRVDLLLARSASNTTGIETCGAAVEYLPGRQQVPQDLLDVTPDRDVLIQRIVNGEIKAALIIGEDPLRHNKVRQYLVNVKFLAVLAETMSETATSADIVLPGATYLEEPGTRVNFEGKVMEFASVLEPPSGRPGWQVLAGLAGAFGLLGIPNSVEQVRDRLRQAVQQGYGAYTPFYWNTGEHRQWDGPLAFQQNQLRVGAHTIANYLTLMQRYKQDASVIGFKHFRVSAK